MAVLCFLQGKRNEKVGAKKKMQPSFVHFTHEFQLQQKTTALTKPELFVCCSFLLILIEFSQNVMSIQQKNNLL